MLVDTSSAKGRSREKKFEWVIINFRTYKGMDATPSEDFLNFFPDDLT